MARLCFSAPKLTMGQEIVTRFVLRVAVSIRAGGITASTILRRLGTYSRKNWLYLAFRELGRVVRTGFLLRYVADTELRATIQAAPNKSQQLNRFLKWVFFGGEGIITENSRDEQRKVIKYNHLVANCSIFHNVCSLTKGRTRQRRHWSASVHISQSTSIGSATTS
jgi:TnpA family transposase